MSLGAAVHRFLEAAVVSREEVDRFLDPEEPNWARFDPELGYLPKASEVRDGADGALSTYRYGAYGERLMINYADRDCRLNSYGDSFTQCHQVSDGETWQEYLAAHLGEPLRNFGVGGYGVYQAYLRLQRMEAAEVATGYTLFNIYLEDHHRSLDAYRRLRVGNAWWDEQRGQPTGMFHANPWRHVRLDEHGTLIECPNPCPTEASLYDLGDRDFLIETFGEDLVVHLHVALKTGQLDFLDHHVELAQALGVPLVTTDEVEGLRSVRQFYDYCAYRSSIMLLERLQEERRRHGSKLLVLLSYPSEAVVDACHGRARPDVEFLRRLTDLGIEYVDTLAAHVSDYAAFSITPEEYVNRYYYGHYTPTGNHFFGFAVKPALLSWLGNSSPA